MDIPVADILRFQNELFDLIDTKYPEITGRIHETHEMDEEGEPGDAGIVQALS